MNRDYKINKTDIYNCLEDIANVIFPEHSKHKNYWLIRTLGGSIYSKFIENKVVAIVHKEIPYSQTKEYIEEYGING